jgi:competence protein ComEC
MPVAVTLGAQAGVALPSLLVFGRLSLVGTVANLVAVPVAGLVMLYGLPACLLAGAVPVIGPVVVAPVGWGTRWVDAVATVAARLEPPAPWSAVGWVVLALIVTSVAVLGNHGEPLR